SYYGINVTTAASGFESIQMCRDNEYDIVFMDHMMPGMDGVEAMKKIRASRDPKGTHLPIVALTANTMSTAREMFAAEGFDGFVSKPINLAELERVMKNVIPDKKIEYVDNEEEVLVFTAMSTPDNSVKDTADTGKAGELTIKGIDVDAGLKYARGDMEFYRTLLSQYVSETPDKKAAMDRAIAAGDIKNFEIIVHGIKSSSKMIGGMSVSEEARALENAAEGGSLPDDATYTGFIDDYLNLSDAISKAIMTKEPEEQPYDSDGDGEIFRFSAKI
ncbi:MAG: response regulator, partial [Lachnospiraceae bacterium]|nr:response regulator [Lachnospiraceae bacterium]